MSSSINEYKKIESGHKGYLLRIVDITFYICKKQLPDTDFITNSLKFRRLFPKILLVPISLY